MSEPAYLFDGPQTGPVRLVLAHGAGAPMDSPFMDHLARGLGGRGLRVARFEFSYMAAARTDGRKRPPDRAPVLLEDWRRVIAELGTGAAGSGGLAIGGKSLGGRMASLVADEAGVRALICLGYPFHPPGKPEKLRTEHLENLATPTLVVQGERDPFGTREEVGRYRLSPAIRIAWCPDGDHSLVPRKRSGRTAEENWDLAVEVVAEFLDGPGSRLGSRPGSRPDSPPGSR